MFFLLIITIAELVQFVLVFRTLEWNSMFDSPLASSCVVGDGQRLAFPGSHTPSAERPNSTNLRCSKRPH
jgi:hypothetical protein